MLTKRAIESEGMHGVMGGWLVAGVWWAHCDEWLGGHSPKSDWHVGNVAVNSTTSNWDVMSDGAESA